MFTFLHIEVSSSCDQRSESSANLACSRLSVGGSERKQRRAKKQTSQGERAGARGVFEFVQIRTQICV